MKKLGFTLVELMASVVIMGVLTSVAVPKVTGYVVKAKVGEIAPAAVSYTKLQSAYLYENKTFGTWKKIGYEAPGGKKAKTENFTYGKGEVTKSIKASNISDYFAGEGKTVWQAENRVGLGDCNLGNQWQIKVVSVSESVIEYQPYLVPSKTSISCKMLTMDWGSFQTLASLDTPPSEYTIVSADPTSSSAGSTPGITPPTSSETVIAAASTPVSSSAIQPVSSSSSSSEIKTTFVDEETGLTEEDDGSCGTLFTTNGDRCPPSWCKLNGNVSKNHGGWSNAGHKWNECYVARQELIQEAKNQNLITCKNEKNCKVTAKGSTIVINGLVISSGDESDEYQDEPTTISAKKQN